MEHVSRPLLRALLPLVLLVTVALLQAPHAAAGRHEGVPRLENPARMAGSVPLVPVRRAHHVRPLTVGERAVRIAEHELGTPYVYGGGGPGGFDCSGLTSYVYAQLGIALPHNAAAQYGYGRPVDLGHLRPGDLLFFHGLGHVGLYIGGGRMIHAPQTGESVSIQPLAARDGGLEGARRIA